jgi:DNA primase
MAKISPVSIKYMIHATLSAEGALEKPDVIGAIFGQTEGLLGADLEMRDLQKEGKIGRIEVEVGRDKKRTIGSIKVPTALDKSETTLIAAAIETIEKIGPCDAQLEIERIEDVRGSKREYIIERAKKLIAQIQGSTDSREISNVIKDSAKIADISEYGKMKLPCGDISGKEIIVVEGRADVVNLLRNNVKNVIAMNGTKLPDEINELGEKKDIILFVDGDRGGKLIIKNVLDNAKIKYIAIAPDGKEVEELTGKEILMHLRKKIKAKDFRI